MRQDNLVSGGPADTEPREPRQRGAGRRSALAALALGLGVMALAGGLFRARRFGDGHATLRSLAEAVGRYRVIAPQLTGGFRHAPCILPEPGDHLINGLVCRADPASPSARRLLKFAARFRAEGARAPSGPRRHASGVYGLLWPAVEGSVAKAVAALERAVADRPDDAPLLSDLGAGLLVRADLVDHPQDLVDALKVLDRALRVDSALPEARFNRALALEYLYLGREAAVAWDSYLRADPRSGWAPEAAAHRARLTQSPPRGVWEVARGALLRASLRGDSVGLQGVVRAWPQEAREYVLEELFAAWAAQGQAGGLEPDTLLHAIRTIGGAILTVTGDALAADAVLAIEQAARRGDRPRLAALREGQIALRRGDELYDRGEYGLATQPLARAERLLALGRTPLREWAAYLLARARYQGASHDEALRQATGIRERAPSDRYPVVRGLAAHMEALIEEVRGRHAAAYRARQEALNALGPTGDAGLVARQHTALADLSARLYGDEVALSHLYRALALMPAIANRVQRFAVLNDVVRHLGGSAPELAVRYQHEALSLAESLEDPLRALYALRHRAELWARTGDTARAADDLHSAERQLGSVPDARTRATARAALRLTGAEIMGRREPEASLRVLGEAIPVFRATADRYQLPFAQVAAARSHLALRDFAPARVAFDSAIAEFERQRRLLDDPGERAQFLDRARPVFDEIVAAEAERGQPASAFDYFERTRARTLVEQTGRPGGARPGVLTAREIQRRLPQGVVIATYAVLEDRLLIWVLARDRLRLSRLAVSSGELRNLVDRMQGAILDAEGGAALPSATGPLYEALVAPLAPDLPAGAHLVVVPDKWLHFVPFAALWNAAAGRFLIEEHPVTLAPSASLSVAAAGRDGRAEAPLRARALILGNPAFDRQATALDDLPFAEAEAQRVAALYSDATLLLRERATRSAFLAQVSRHDVIHFAGHAVARPEAPHLSHLVLAADSARRDAGTLYAHELERLRLPRARLVVLSGCRTAGGRLSPTEGASSLARAFLAAGATAVVASLWEVEDQSTAEFFAVYHALLVETGDPLTALRTTQLRFLRAGDAAGRGARTWAAFQLFGGV